MSDQELLKENERLRIELEAANKSRERLREIICAILPLDPPDVIEKQVLEMMNEPPQGIEDLIKEMLRDEPEVPHNGQQIPA